jgi:hypothetical protein
MSMTTRRTLSKESEALSALAWFFGFAAIVLFICAVAGCADIAKIGELLTTKPTGSITAPGDDITQSIFGLLANPLNWNMWAQLGAGLSTVAGGYIVWRKAKGK